MSPLPRRIVASLICIAAAVACVVAAPQAEAAPASLAQTTITPSIASVENTLAGAMFVLLNQERRLHGKPAVLGVMSLRNSAHEHNLMMAQDNLMSHQCPGEAAPSTRITLAGYRWSAWGENVGWTSTEDEWGLLQMEKFMYNEVAPNDGHRLNILGSYKNVGIDVYFDPVHHIMWYTQDFGAPI
jgi:uncharacterized protein YkwD